MKVQLVATGFDELKRAFESMPERVSKQVQRQALMAGGEFIRSRASELAPRGPGRRKGVPNLADHIDMAVARNDEGGASVGIGSTRFFFHDMWQEFGTSDTAPRPFYRPALDEQVPKAIQVIGSSLWESIIRRGFGSARVPQGSSETLAEPEGPSVMGGPGGALL